MTAFIAILVSLAGAADSTAQRSPAGTPRADRSRSLDFEENVVEGMNSIPRDSLDQLSRRDSRDGARLYRKRTSYRQELIDFARGLGELP